MRPDDNVHDDGCQTDDYEDVNGQRERVGHGAQNTEHRKGTANEMGLGTLELCQGHDLSCSSHGNENGNVNDHVDWLIRQKGEGVGQAGKGQATCK